MIRLIGFFTLTTILFGASDGFAQEWAPSARNVVSEGTDAAMMHASNSAVTARVTPPFSFSPSQVRALVQVPRHPDNRRLRIRIDSGSYYRSSDIQLDGDAAPKSHLLVWKSLPPGNYCFEAILSGSIAPRAYLRREFVVLGRSVMTRRSDQPSRPSAARPAKRLSEIVRQRQTSAMVTSCRKQDTTPLLHSE